MSHKSTLINYKQSEVVEKVEIISTTDSCLVCKEASKHIYMLDEELISPTLPIKECSHEKGCRCCYAAHFDD